MTMQKANEDTGKCSQKIPHSIQQDSIFLSFRCAQKID